MYLPSHSTIDEACEWLNHQTGQKWTLPRLLEDGHLRVYVWIDYVEGLPHVFGDRREGYLTEMVFHGDVMRLAADRDEAVLTWITTHDGKPQQTGAWRVELKHVRFKRDALERVAEIINRTKAAKTESQADTPPAPMVDAPASEPKAKRKSAFNEVLAYLQTVHRNGKFKTTGDFIRELGKQSGEVDSPFKKATRTDETFYLKSGGGQCFT